MRSDQVSKRTRGNGSHGLMSVVLPEPAEIERAERRLLAARDRWRSEREANDRSVRREQHPRSGRA